MQYTQVPSQKVWAEVRGSILHKIVQMGHMDAWEDVSSGLRKKIWKDTNESSNKYISPRFNIKLGTKKTEMSFKCRKIFPNENLKISFKPEDLTGSSIASTQVKSLSRSEQKTKAEMKSQSDDPQQLKNNQNLNNFDLDKNKYFLTNCLILLQQNSVRPLKKMMIQTLTP